VIDRAWLVTALLATVVTVLLEAPAFFDHHAGLAAAPLLILTGAGAATPPRSPSDTCACPPRFSQGGGSRRRPRHDRRPGHRVRLRRCRAPARRRLPRRTPFPGGHLEPLRHSRLTRGADPDGSPEPRSGTTLPGMNRRHRTLRHVRPEAPERGPATSALESPVAAGGHRLPLLRRRHHPRPRRRGRPRSRHASEIDHLPFSCAIPATRSGRFPRTATTEPRPRDQAGINEPVPCSRDA
jgi:hypothetical protein